MFQDEKSVITETKRLSFAMKKMDVLTHHNLGLILMYVNEVKKQEPKVQCRSKKDNLGQFGTIWTFGTIWDNLG